MKRSDKLPEPPGDLYRRAREALAERRFDVETLALAEREIDLDALVEDLRIHHAELAIQNQELQSSRADLERSLEHFATLFALLPIAVLIVDDKGQIREANPAAERLFRLVGNPQRRRSFPRLVGEADRAAVIKTLVSLRGAQQAELNEIALRNDKGEVFTGDLRIKSLPGRQNGDQKTAFVCAVIDQSEAVRQRERLRESAESLRRSRAELTTRVAELACLHDIAKLKLQHELPTGVILQQIADRLADALQWPEQVRVEIRLRAETFTPPGTSRFEPVRDIPFDLPDGGQGSLLVTTERDIDGQPWTGTPEQIALIEAVADHLEGFLRERSARDAYRVLAEYNPEWEYWLGPDDRYRYVSPACEQVSGYPAAAFEEDANLFPRLLHPQDRDRYLARRDAVRTQKPSLQHRDSEPMELRLRTRGGEWIWIEHLCTPVIDGDGRRQGWRGSNRNITGRKAAELALDESNRHLREAETRRRLTARVFESTADAVLITDPELKIQAVNRAFCQITGYLDDQVQGKALCDLQTGVRDDDLFSTIRGLLSKTWRWRGERWILRKDGELFRARISITTVTATDESPLNHIVAFSDITSHHQTREQLDYLTRHDALTGLPNRSTYRLRLEHGLHRASRNSAGLAVLILDIDRFRVVNESLGTHVGDELLKLVAVSLLGVLRNADTLARLGGDELGMIVEDLAAEQKAAEIAARLLQRCAVPHGIDGQSLVVTATIGIAVFPSNGSDGETLLRRADIALKRAKARGPNRYMFYQAEMDVDAAERLRIESCLRNALAGDELHLHYQPQVRIRDGELVGAEALLRWDSPQLGKVPPGRFIPIAEDMGLIDELGLWVLAQACAQLNAWDRAGRSLPRLAINISIRQIEQEDLVARIAQVLEQSGVDPARLELEITESLIMREAEESIATLAALREIGLRLVIDDFGTGYSSLAYLRRLPLEQLKIDKSFVDDLTSDANSQAVARAVIALGRSLGLEILAEGVEHPEQAAWLQQAGCELAQGYHYARPLPPDTLAEQWLPVMA